MSKKVLITGANGLIGGKLAEELYRRANYSPIGAVRSSARMQASSPLPLMEIGDLSVSRNFMAILDSVDSIIHTAARVHVMKEESKSPLDEYRKVNVQGTMNIALQAAKAGVRRFIFLSTIKVNGEQTSPGLPFSHLSNTAPLTPYGISKSEAEEELRNLAKTTEMQIVIIRLPLVYGSGVKGNFQSLIKLINSGIPLPFGSISNKRSFIALDNVVDIVLCCLDHPQAANQTFLVSDGEDLSTPELIRKIGKVMNKKPKLIRIPARILRLCLSAAGKHSIYQRLASNLQVDSSHVCTLLDWHPPISVEEGLSRTLEIPNGAK